MRRKISPQRSTFKITKIYVKPLYILGCILYGCIWIFGHGNEKRYVVLFIIFQTEQFIYRAVVQVYTELSKHLQKNMKSSIHFHLTKSKIHLIFSKTTNTSMPPNCHSDICSSIWFAGPIERWTKQRNEHELPYSLVILKMRDDCGRAESCYPVMQNVNWLTHRKHYNIASTCVSYWTVIKYK